MDFRILGSLEVWEGERQIELGGPKRRAVLAYLLLHANEVVAVDRLVDRLWGEKPPRNASGALQTHVSRLRKDLGAEVVATRAWGYVLRSEPGDLDLERFERLTAEAENRPARERAESLREALALWRGRPLEDLAFEPALAGDIARLEELRLTVLENRIDADLETGNANGLVAELETLIAEYPLRERMRGQLILALYRCGRQAEALEVYRETRRVLADELGLEPSPELRELERAILQQDPALRVNPARAAVVADATVRPGRRRRIFAGAAFALLLAGLGTATAVAVSMRPTHSSVEEHTTLLTVIVNNTNQTGPLSDTRIATGQATTATGQSTQQKPSTTKPHSLSRGLAGHTPTTAQATASVPLAQHQQKGTGPGKPKPFTIADDLAGDYVDPTIWHEVTDGGDVHIVEQGGALQLTVGQNAVPGGQWNQIDVHVGTQCSWPGRFDARVHYTLLEWPARDNIDVGLNAIYAGGAVMRESSSQWGDQYASWVDKSNGSVQIPDTSGTLRITRINGFETTYFLHNGSWRTIARSYDSGAAVFGLQAMSDGGSPFGGQEVKVAFDHFKVTGIDPMCAPGDAPAS